MPPETESTVQAAPQQTIEQRIAASLSAEDAPPEPVSRPERAPETVAEESEVEVTEAAAEPAEGEVSTVEGEEEVIEVETLEDLAEHIGVDIKDLYNIQIKVDQGDGTSAAMTLSEAKEAQTALARHKTQAAALQQSRESFEKETAQAKQALRQSLTDAAAVLKAAEEQLIGEYQSVNWNELSQTDPAEWAMQRQHYQERLGRIEQAKQQAMRTHAEAMQRQQAEESARIQQMATAERERLLDVLPSWRDPVQAKADQQAIATYLTDNGFTPRELEHVVDHRQVLIARKAMLYDQQQKAANAATKKVVRLGKKVLRPGAKTDKREERQNHVAPVVQAHRRSQSIDSAAALIKALEQ